MYEIELIDTLDMKEGEMYLINRHGYIIEVIFMEYHTPTNGQPFATFTYPNCPVYFTMSLTISVYRYISEYSKLKEHYSKCLDIVLRCLI